MNFTYKESKSKKIIFFRLGVGVGGDGGVGGGGGWSKRFFLLRIQI